MLKITVSQQSLIVVKAFLATETSRQMVIMTATT